MGLTNSEGFRVRQLIGACIFTLASTTNALAIYCNPPPWLAGDANQDFFFTPADIVQVLWAGKYQTGLAATWGEGDWDAAPWQFPWEKPSGDGVFDEHDIVTALLTGRYLPEGPPSPSPLPGDADRDLDFDQLDLVRVQVAAKYLTGKPATWGEGDWVNSITPWDMNPSVGDGLFNQFDIIASLRTGWYLNPGCGGPPPAFLQARQQAPSTILRSVVESESIDSLGASHLESTSAVMAVPSPDGLSLLLIASTLLMTGRYWRWRDRGCTKQTLFVGPGGAATCRLKQTSCQTLNFLSATYLPVAVPASAEHPGHDPKCRKQHG